MKILLLSLKYFESKFIIARLMLISRKGREAISEENYLLFKLFCREFNISSHFKKSDTPARISMPNLYKKLHFAKLALRDQAKIFAPLAY